MLMRKDGSGLLGLLILSALTSAIAFKVLNPHEERKNMDPIKIIG